MLDTLVTIIALAHPVPVAVTYPPAPARPVPVVRAAEHPPESLSTCYQSRSGSCWTEE